MNSIFATCLRLMLGLCCLVSACAAPIKLGTIVPVGTSYHKILMALGESWKKDSQGAVELKIFAGGKAGGEAEMVGLMLQNSLQGALLTATGLAEIEPGVTGTQMMPMAFRDLDEVNHVIERLRPRLEALLEKKGFVVLFWTHGGWVRFFSRKPALLPDEMRAQKVFTWSGSTEQGEVMRHAGFKPVPLETADIVPALQTGLVDVVPLPPYYALATQADLRAPHMLDLNWAPIVGACILRKATWEKIPEAQRGLLLRAAEKAGAEMKETAKREGVESVAAMKKRGLKVLELNEGQRKAWQDLALSVYPMIRGQVVPAEVFDEALRLIEEYRRTQTPAAGP